MLLSLFFSSALIACQHCYKPLIVGTIQGESAVLLTVSAREWEPLSPSSR
jgi:hypothetical protein